MAHAQTLLEIDRTALHQWKQLRIVRVDRQDEPEKYAFWYSARQNTETTCLTIKDLQSFWLVIGEREEPGRPDHLPQLIKADFGPDAGKNYKKGLFE